MRDIYPTVLGYKLCFSFTCIESDLGIAFSVSGGRVSIIFFLFLKKNHKAPPRLPTHGLTPHTEFRQNVYRRPERPPFVSFDPVDNMVCPSFSATTPAVGIAGSTFGFFFFFVIFFFTTLGVVIDIVGIRGQKLLWMVHLSSRPPLRLRLRIRSRPSFPVALEVPLRYLSVCLFFSSCRAL